MFSLLHRYVLWELLRVFVLSLVVITSILVMAGIVAEAAQQGFGPGQIIKLVPLLLPGFLPFTVPATTLFAVAVVYGRLAHDNEITAIKAAGVPVTKVIWPSVLLGVCLSGGMLVLHTHFIPYTHHLIRNAALDDIEEVIYTALRRELHLRKPGVNYEIHVKGVQGRRLLTPTFKRRDASGRDEIIAQAREAVLKVDLREGVINIYMTDADISKDYGKTYLYFEREIIPVPLPPIGAARKVRGRELSNEQLLERWDGLLERRDELQGEAERARGGERLAPERGPITREFEISHKLTMVQKEIWELETEFHARPALSVSCLFFVLIGCPVGIWAHRGDYLSAFVTCFLPIVAVYYPLMMFGINLGKEGKLDPAYSMWVGNAVLGSAALVLLYRLIRR